MSSYSVSGITILLRAWSNGDRNALENLIPIVYDDLYRTAKRYMAREKPGHLLQSAALVNETYLQLTRLGNIEWQDRVHFFAVCSQLMRHILTDYARARLQAKNGGDVQHVPFDEGTAAARNPGRELLALDEALHSLAQFDRRKSQVVELRIFGGLSIEETAAALNISIGTVKGDWRLARMWLLRELDRRNQNEN